LLAKQSAAIAALHLSCAFMEYFNPPRHDFYRIEERQKLSGIILECNTLGSLQNYLRAALISSHPWPDWLADVTGLTTVHVIRAAKALCTDGLVRLDDRQLVIQN
jgi:hypothetical protein